MLGQVKIQALAFSPDEQRLASLGGQDDNSLVGHCNTDQPPLADQHPLEWRMQWQSQLYADA